MCESSRWTVPEQYLVRLIVRSSNLSKAQNVCLDSSALLSRCLTHFKLIRAFQHLNQRVRYFVRSYDEISSQILNRGHHRLCSLICSGSIWYWDIICDSIDYKFTLASSKVLLIIDAISLLIRRDDLEWWTRYGDIPALLTLQLMLRSSTRKFICEYQICEWVTLT